VPKRNRAQLTDSEERILRGKALASLAIMGIILGGCATERWSKETYEASRPRKVSVAGLEGAGTGVMWSTSVLGGEVEEIYPLGDIVCVYTKAKRLIVLDANRGVELWRVLLPLRLQFGPFRHRDVVYFSLHDAIYGFDAKTGEELWTKRLEVALSSPPTLFADQLMAGSNTNIFGAWPIRSDRVTWSILRCRTTEKAVVSGSTVYVPSMGGLLRAVDVASGRVRWSYPTGRDFMTSPTLITGGVALGTDEGGVYRISEEGKKGWLTVLKRPVKRVLAEGDVVAAMTVPDGAVMVNAETGEEGPTVAKASKLAAISDKVACFLAGGELVAVSREDGQESWRLPLGEFSVVAENPTSDEVYCSTKSGAMAALKLK